MLFKKLIVFFLLIFLAHRTIADVFVVTSNADAGTGTLREALMLAAANGSATTDYINFNLPDLSEAGRTIKLTSQLPDVSSNLIIDGSTQPGAKFGVSDAKVGLFYQPSIVQDLSGLKVFEQHDVKIFGLYIKFLRDPNQQRAYNWVGLELNNGKDVQIGDNGKGNVLSGFTTPIYVSPPPPQGGQYTSHFENLILKANIFGMEADGVTVSSTASTCYVNHVIGKVIIGGSPSEGNVFSQGLQINQNNVYNSTNPIDYYVSSPAEFYIQNNKIGVNYNADQVNPVTSGLSITTVTPGGKNTCYIEDNVIASNLDAIRIINSGAPIYIIRNYIGTDKLLQKKFRTGGIFTYWAAKVHIGDNNPANANFITNTKPVNIWPFSNVTVNKNSFFCTQDAYPMHLQPASVDFFPSVNILTISSASVKGTATPNSSVELFYSDLCGTCSPETYFASVTADANGKWEYNGPISRTVIASATINGRTSEFTKLDIDVSSIKIINACNGLGSITGVVPKNSTGFKWVDVNGNTVGTTADLLNVPIGKYKMVAQNGNCSAESIYFQIVDALKINPAVVQIKNSSCSNADGAITGLIVNNSTSGQPKYSWKNGSGAEIGTALDIKNVVAGIYTLTVTTADGSCAQTYGPVNIQNTTGPNINQSQVSIQPSNCGQSIGSITGITATGSGTLIYTWKNAQQQIVGTTANLLNQPAGIYTLEVKDGGTCGPIYTSALTIPELNGITMDEKSVQQTPASCNKSDGGIKGIEVTGATSYAWYNSNNVLMSTGIDLAGVLSGTYYLIASNTTCSRQSKNYTVVQDVNLITITGTPTITNDQCGQKKGSITGLNLSGGLPPFNYRWTDVNNTVVATTANASGLGAGTYTLTVMDASPCGAFLVTYTVQNQDAILPPPSVNGVKLCSGGNIILAVNNASSTYGYRLYDAFNSSIPLAEEKLGKFNVAVKNNRSYYISQYIGQCESSRAEVKVSVGISSLDIANAFTPNGDGINDFWKIIGIENTPTATVQVFNRNGQNVFESKGYTVPFDGKLNNQNLSTGVYYYVINMGAACNLISGNLTIIR